MPESRDRLARPEEMTAIFARRRQSIRGLTIFSDDEETDSGARFRRGATVMTDLRGSVGLLSTRRGGVARGRLGTQGIGNRRGLSLSGSPAVGQENMPSGNFRRGQGRGRGSVLPSWYPRTPLRDITAVVRAIERRRASLRESEGLQLESPLPQGQNVLNPSEHLSGAQLENNFSLISPNPTLGKNPCVTSVGKVPKLLLNITSQNVEGTVDCLTPQKKLLNSIETVEKVVKDELRRLKRTPSARKAERDRKVRTLMSLR